VASGRLPTFSARRDGRRPDFTPSFLAGQSSAPLRPPRPTRPAPVYPFEESIMMRTVRWMLAALAVSAAWNSPALGQQSLEAGADQAVKGTKSMTVNVGRHGFQIETVKIEHTADGLRASGRIIHKITGKDDFAHYVIEVKKGQDPVITLDRIEYGGLFGGSGKVKLAVNWVGRKVGAAPVLDTATKSLNLTLKGLNAIQRKLIGKWEPSVLQVLDVLAARVAQEAK
jgi:hypothetical protein